MQTTLFSERSGYQRLGSHGLSFPCVQSGSVAGGGLDVDHVVKAAEGFLYLPFQ